MSTTALPLPSARSPRQWRVELGLFAAVYVVYLVARWLAAGELGPALEHARWLIDVERDLGLAVERQVQDALDHETFVWVMSNVYLAAQLVVVPLALVYLYRKAPAIYRRLRDTVLATWLLAVPIFTLFPVAPPRLAGIGLIDSVSEQAGVALTGRSTLFYNPFAAVPSLHCGFAFAVGLALAASAKRRVTRYAALAWGPIVSLTVVVTGNHYLLDIVAGLAVTVVGYSLGRVWFSGSPRLRLRRARGPVRPRLAT